MTPKTIQIDETDREILTMLQDNGRVSNAEIARSVGRAPSAVLERVRKLEASGAIQGYEARIDPRAAGLFLTAFTFVHTEHSVGNGTAELGRELAELPEAMEVHYTAGSATYLLKVRAADNEALADLLQRIGNIPGVRDTNSTIVLRTVKETARVTIS